MKKLLLAILILVSVGFYEAPDASIKKVNESVVVGIKVPLDTAGLPVAPDSIHVVTWLDNATTAAYTASITAIDGDQWDTITVGGRLNYVFRDAIADIDGGGGNSELGIFITAFCAGLPTQSDPYHVQVIGDSLETRLRSTLDSVVAILDSIANAATLAHSANVHADTIIARGVAMEATVAALPSAGDISTELTAQGFVRYSQPDSTLNLAGLHVRATGADDTAIIAVGGTGTTSGIGIYALGGYTGMFLTGTTYYGLYAGGGSIGIYGSGGGANGTGFRAGGPHGINATGTTDDITGNIIGSITRADSVGAGAVTAIGASTLDSATVQGAVIAAMNADTTMRLKNLIILDTQDDDTAGIYVKSSVDGGISIITGADNAIYGFSNTAATVALSNGTTSTNPTVQVTTNGSNDAVKLLVSSSATGSPAALDLKNEQAQTETGYALRATSSAGKFTWYVSNTSDALLGGALFLAAEGDSAWTATVTQGSDDTTIHGGALQFEGKVAFGARYDRDEPAILVHKYHTGNPALYIYADSAPAVRLSTSNPAYYDTSVLIGGNISLGGNKFVGEIVGNITGHVDTALVAAWVDTVDYTKDGAITATLSGTGAYSVQLLILDTLPATDAPIIDANVTIRNLAQTNYVAWDVSDINGLTSFNLDTGQYAVLTRRAGCGFPTPDTIHVTGIMTDTIMGYNTNASKTCATSVVVYGQDGDPLKNVSVTAQLLGNNLRDSTGNPIGTWIQASKTDSTGEATFNCLWSSYIIPSTKWRFAIQSPMFGNAYKDITIPRSTSYQVSFIK